MTLSLCIAKSVAPICYIFIIGVILLVIFGIWFLVKDLGTKEGRETTLLAIILAFLFGSWFN